MLNATTAGGLRGLTGVLLASLAATTPSAGQSPQYRSPAGVEYRSQADTGTVARAEHALMADPGSVERILQLALAQSGVRQFREAIQTLTRGLAIAPDHAVLYRWRGHRHLSVREFDRALADLTRGDRLDSTNYGILYHLGIVRYARGDFAGAAEAFRRAQPRAPDAGELAGSTDWLWMSLSRAGKGAEAQAMLDRRPDSLPVSNAYSQRLRLYRGEIGPAEVITAADTGDVAVATLSYGIGNWYLVRGDTARARSWFDRAVDSGGWPAFGFILAEIDLGRLPVTPAAPPSPTRRDLLVTTNATGTFDVKLTPEASDEGAGSTLGRMAIAKEFHGDLEGTSTGAMLSALTPTKGSAGYVAIERVTGTLHGRRGSFTLQHSGSMGRGEQQLVITVVSDSGTEALTGLSGRMKIIIQGGKHSYEFEYTLP
jgi:tetratricopeptide (TPR) repeat protein